MSLADSPETPHNDYLLVSSQLGILGVVLLGSHFICFYLFLNFLAQGALCGQIVREGHDYAASALLFITRLAETIALALCMTATFVFYILH